MSDESTTAAARTPTSPARRHCAICRRNRRIALVELVDKRWMCRDAAECNDAIAHAATQREIAHAVDLSLAGTDRLKHFARLASIYRDNILASAVDALLSEVRLLNASLADCQRDLVAVHGAVPSWAEGKTLGERVAHVAQRAERKS